MLDRLLSPLRRARRYWEELQDPGLVRECGLFDEEWYLSKYPDVAAAHGDALLHYLRHGAAEGRDPGPKFSSRAYLASYPEVKASGINPLVHYVRYGRAQGRLIVPVESDARKARFRCPVCGMNADKFLAIDTSMDEKKKRLGNPYTYDDFETINPLHYTCPNCGASDRDRLYALYLAPLLGQQRVDKILHVLDIAPSWSLRSFLLKFPNVLYRSADRYMPGVDLTLDVTNMDIIESESIDLFICSHVLEHVPDDRQALRELYRILAHHGFGILMVPINLKIEQIDEDPTVTDEAERLRRFGQADHLRLYSKAGFIERVRNAGFVIHEYGCNDFGRETLFRSGVSDRSVLYVVSRE